jgi:AcrR family transcriptional regulator
VSDATPGAVGAPAVDAAPGKGERTRSQILETALALLLERGYERTTMRAIAEAADVSVGNAYYYFRSKEHLIHAFYARTHDEHLAACRDVLARERDLGRRLLGVMRARIDTAMPYHLFAGVLFRTAADPASPLNPFGEESRALREQSTAVFAEVVEGSGVRVGPPRLRAELPHLLWLYQMGVILYWIHDTSPGCARTYRLCKVTAAAVTRLVRLARYPVLRPLVRSLLEVTAELRQP